MELVPVTPANLPVNRTLLEGTEAIQRWAAQETNTNTKAAYYRDMTDFQQWCDVMGVPVVSADADVVVLYVQHLLTVGCPCMACGQAPRRGAKPLANSTVARRLAALTSFYEYLIDRKVITHNPAARAKRPKVASTSDTYGPSADELSRLLAVAEERGLQALALVGLLGLTGLRVSEVLSIQVGDLVEKRGHQVIEVTRKGGDRQMMVVAPCMVPVIRELSALREHDPILVDEAGNPLPISRPLFRNGKGAALGRQQASALVASMARRAGCSGQVTAHSLRHAYVTLALDAGVNYRDVAAGAGHKDIRTTMRYDRARQSLERSPTYAVTSHLTWQASRIA